MKGNDNKTMKILINLNASDIISKIKYPFIKIASLFERVTVSNRIQIRENPKYLSAQDISRLPTDNSLSDVTNEVNEDGYEDIDEYNGKVPLQPDASLEHLYTRINKTGNGKIHRYLPSDENVGSDQNRKVIQPKSGLPHPFLREMTPPPVPPKNSLLIQELRGKNVPSTSLVAKDFRPLSILKEFELFI